MKEQIIERLEKILYERDVLRAKEEIERHKQAYHNLLTADGKEVATFTTDPLDQAFEDVVHKLKIKEENILLRQKNEEELVIFEKQEVIRDLKKLLKKGEDVGQSYEPIKEIQDRWKNTGKLNTEGGIDLQNEYNYQLELFYHNIKINKELRDMDYQRNLEAKREIIQEADRLADIKDIRELESAARKLQDDWRFTGPVPWDLKDSIYEEFRGKCDVAYGRINAHYDSRREGLNEKLRQKIELCEKVHDINSKEIATPKNWIANTDVIIQAQKDWKKVGFSSENETIWNVFKNACDVFFEKKRVFFESIDEKREENAKSKEALIQRAEGLKNNKDWKVATEKFLGLQKEWQTIGSAGRKDETKLWNRFRSACDFFFNAKRDFFTSRNSEQEDNLKIKTELIERIETMELSEEPENDFLALKQISATWNDTGFVPFDKKDELIQQYRNAMQEKYDALRLNESQRKDLEFQNRVHKLMAGDNPNQIINLERRKIRDKIDRLRAQINQYENNIGFFGQAAEDSPLVKDIRNKMTTLKNQVNDLESKLVTMKNVVSKSKEEPAENNADNAEEATAENNAANTEEATAENNTANTEEATVEGVTEEVVNEASETPAEDANAEES